MTLQVHLMSNDAHHWKLCPESTENWGNSDLVTSPSLGILRVRLFPSCSSWFTFDANTLFFSHNTLCTSVALLLPPISGPDLFGPMAFWIIVQFVGIYHKPKRIQNSEVSLLSRCHLSVHLRLMNLSTWVCIYLLFCVYPSLHPIVCVHASSCLCCVQETVNLREMKVRLDMNAAIAVSQNAQENKNTDMADSTCIKSGIRHNTMTCQMVKKAGTDVFNVPRAFLPPGRDHDMRYAVAEGAKGHVITSAICHSKR